MNDPNEFDKKGQKVEWNNPQRKEFYSSWNLNIGVHNTDKKICFNLFPVNLSLQ